MAAALPAAVLPLRPYLHVHKQHTSAQRILGMLPPAIYICGHYPVILLSTLVAEQGPYQSPNRKTVHHEHDILWPVHNVRGIVTTMCSVYWSADVQSCADMAASNQSQWQVMDG